MFVTALLAIATMVFFVLYVFFMSGASSPPSSNGWSDDPETEEERKVRIKKWPIGVIALVLFITCFVLTCTINSQKPKAQSDKQCISIIKL